jgi:hypothetical protein
MDKTSGDGHSAKLGCLAGLHFPFSMKEKKKTEGK